MNASSNDAYEIIKAQKIAETSINMEIVWTSQTIIIIEVKPKVALEYRRPSPITYKNLRPIWRRKKGSAKTFHLGR